MTRLRSGGTGSRRLRATIVAGVAGGVVGAAVKLLARRARRRREQGEREFSRASDGLWPPVHQAAPGGVTIAATRATPGEPAAAPGTGGERADEGPDEKVSGATPAGEGPGEALVGEEPTD